MTRKTGEWDVRTKSVGRLTARRIVEAKRNEVWTRIGVVDGHAAPFRFAWTDEFAAMNGHGRRQVADTVGQAVDRLMNGANVASRRFDRAMRD